MRRTAAAGIAAETDQVTLVNHISGFYKHILQMGVPGFKSEVVHNHNSVATEL